MDLGLSSLSKIKIPTLYFNAADRQRLKTIQSIVNQLRHLLNRPLRVLELGCGSPFFSLHLASQGDEVIGFDSNLDHIIYCQRLAKNHKLNAQFHSGNYTTCFSALPDPHFDLLLGFGVFADIVQQQGYAATKQFVEDLTHQVTIALLSTAVEKPKKRWGKISKPDPYNLLESFAYIEPLSKTRKIFTDYKNSWFFCSNSYWYTHQKIQRFSTWTNISREIFPHEDFTVTHAGKRRYYFTDTHILKHFRLERKNGSNQQELKNEIKFFKKNQTKLKSLPQLVDYRLKGLSGWILREKLPGIRLSTKIAQGQPYDAQRILGQVLQQLTHLEDHGLYQQDIRTWNFILNEQGNTYMIDFGQIGHENKDILSHLRSNILTFFMFAFEVVHGLHLPHRYLAPMHLNINYFPKYFYPVLKGMLRQDFKKWTYRLIWKYWQEGGLAVQEDNDRMNWPAWLKEMEGLKHTSQGFEQFEFLFIEKLRHLSLKRRRELNFSKQSLV